MLTKKEKNLDSRSGWWRQILRKDKENILMRATRSFVFQAGQPDHVKTAYEEALGIKMENGKPT